MTSSIHELYRELGADLGLDVPDIASYHSGPFSTAVVLSDPGGKFTAGSGAQTTQEIGVENPDPTAAFLKNACLEAGLDIHEYLPLNALAGFDLRPNNKNLRLCAKLNSQIIRVSGVRVVILGGALARRSLDFLDIDRSVAVVEMPHPSRRGRANASRNGQQGSTMVKAAFVQAKRIVSNSGANK